MKKATFALTDIIFIVVLAILLGASVGMWLCIVIPGCKEKVALQQDVVQDFVTHAQAYRELNAYLEVKDGPDKSSDLWFLYKATGDASARTRAANIYNTMFANRKTKLFIDTAETIVTGSCVPVANSPSATRKIALPNGSFLTLTLRLCR